MDKKTNFSICWDKMFYYNKQQMTTLLVVKKYFNTHLETAEIISLDKCFPNDI